jgi:hypothetical protein
MVEIPSIKENSSIEDNISWEDLQGLSWILSDEFSIESMKKTTYACA